MLLYNNKKDNRNERVPISAMLDFNYLKSSEYYLSHAHFFSVR